MPSTPTFREAIGAALSGVSPAVEERVVAAYVEKEVGRRADAIVKGLDQLDSIERELKKIGRPDHTTFNADRTVASETYSKARLDEIAAAEKKRDKLVTGLDKALSGDMGDLLNLVGGGGKREQSPRPEADAA